MSDQDKYDELCADFSDVNKSIVDLQAQIADLTAQQASPAPTPQGSKGKRGQSAGKSAPQVAAEVSQKLSQLKSELGKMEMEKSQIVARMNDLQ